MNLEQARFNMVEQQIRPWEVLDQDVLDLLYVVRREEFVPAEYRALAFSDIEIPLGDGERMWAPKIEARVLQALGAKKNDRALEVGTGSGYFAAPARALRAPCDERRDQSAAEDLRRAEPAAPGDRQRDASSLATRRRAGARTLPTTSSCSPARRRCCRKRSSRN